VHEFFGPSKGDIYVRVESRFRVRFRERVQVTVKNGLKVLKKVSPGAFFEDLFLPRSDFERAQHRAELFFR
jgi:hypothetical protein